MDIPHRLTAGFPRETNFIPNAYALVMPKIHGAVTIEKERCKGCDLCVVACPCDVLSLQPKEVNDRGYHFAYPANEEACIGCAACAMVCPDACIEVYRVVVK